MEKIKIQCETCGQVMTVNRTDEIPPETISLGCNWCPACEDDAEGPYEEWYNDFDHDEEADENQTELFPY